MSLRRSIIALLVLLVMGVAGCGGEEPASTSAPTQSGDDGAPLSLDLTAERTVVTVTVTNTSDGDLTVVRPFVTPHFVSFAVTGPDGEIPFDGPFGRLEPLTEADVVTLAPGESVSSDFDLTEHFALPSAEIAITAEYRAREVHHGGLAMTVEPGDGVVAAPLVVEVAP